MQFSGILAIFYWAVQAGWFKVQTWSSGAVQIQQCLWVWHTRELSQGFHTSGMCSSPLMILDLLYFIQIYNFTGLEINWDRELLLGC